MWTLSLPAEAVNKSTIEKRKKNYPSLILSPAPPNNFLFCQDNFNFNFLLEAAFTTGMAFGVWLKKTTWKEVLSWEMSFEWHQIPWQMMGMFGVAGSHWWSGGAILKDAHSFLKKMHGSVWIIQRTLPWQKSREDCVFTAGWRGST